MRVDPPALAAWTLAFSSVAYLALSNGGYDTVARSEVGIAIWWIVLLGCLAGVLPARIGRAAWVPIGLLAAFAAWTGLAIGWSESAERSAIELGRVATHLGALVLVISLQGRSAARHTINGLACAIGFVTVLAVLSRLHPQAFPANDHAAFFGPGSARRLSYPLNYWNGLAAFAAMGVPLLIAVAVGARTRLAQALAAATLPLSALCLYLTISRGGAIALATGAFVFFVLMPRRLDALATTVVAAAGSAILLVAAGQRDLVQDGVSTQAAIAQGTELLWLALIVCAGVAMLQVALGLATRHLRRPAWMAPGRRATLAAGVALLLVAAVIAVGVGAPGAVNERWKDFKAPYGSAAAGSVSDDNLFSRLQAANGSGRYESWQGALAANETDRAKGIGPGTFEFWWARNGTTPGFQRDAHSLYMETLAETGIVGLVLLAGMLLWLLGVLALRSWRATAAVRLWLAAAGGSLTAFLTAAAYDWVWELGAVAIAAMVLGGVIVAGRDDADGELPAPAAAPARAPRAPSSSSWRSRRWRRSSCRSPARWRPATAARRLRPGACRPRSTDTRTAERVQPYAATPHLQRALVLEQAGDLAGAASAARASTRAEPTNWRTWFVLARVDARRGQTAAALRELRTARALNPRSPLLAAR